METRNQEANEEIETLVLINEELGKESDKQSKSSESDRGSEGEGEKEPSDPEPPQSQTRSFDPKAARVMLILNY